MAKRYTIKRADMESAKWAAIVSGLHWRTLPDAPMPLLRGWWWVVMGGREPVGFAGLFRSESHPGAGYLCRAGVLPAHRGHGLQRRLIAVRERHARRLGMTMLVSDTTESPVSAHNLERSGYETFMPAKPWFLKKTLYWRKALTKT